MKNANIEQRLDTLRELSQKAIQEMVAIELELSAIQNEMLRSVIDNDEQRQMELIDQIREYGLCDPQATTQECMDILADIIKDFSDLVIDASAEIPQFFNLRTLVGAKKRCPSCGSELLDTDEYCHECGSHVGAERPYVEGPTIHCNKCHSCGHTYNAEYKHCPQCGTAASDQPSSLAAHYKSELDAYKHPDKQDGFHDYDS